MSFKIQKILAAKGLGSRRFIEKEISAKKIKVNKKLAVLGQRVEVGDFIEYGNKKITVEKEQTENEIRLLLLHKPVDYICTNKDEKGRKRVITLLPKLKGEKWTAVGRLDINTSGLMIFTNNGNLANKLMHPSSNISRKYLVRHTNKITEEIKKNLLAGVIVENKLLRLDNLKVTKDEGYNNWCEVSLSTGANNEIRKLFLSQDLEISRLIRTNFATLSLPQTLRAKQYIELTQKEISAFLKSLNINL